MACHKTAVATAACALIPAFDTMTVVGFSRKRVVLGVASALASAVVQILVMRYIDAHVIAAVAAVSIPASVYCASAEPLTTSQKWAIACILAAIPVGFAARSAREPNDCPRQDAVAALYAVTTLLGVMFGLYGGARTGNPRFLPAADGVLATAATLSAELVAVGTYEGVLPLATHGCAALAAAAVSLRRNTAAYHVPTSYAIWAAGLVVADLAVGHNINLAYAVGQTALSALGVRLLL